MAMVAPRIIFLVAVQWAQSKVLDGARDGKTPLHVRKSRLMLKLRNRSENKHRMLDYVLRSYTPAEEFMQILKSPYQPYGTVTIMCKPRSPGHKKSNSSSGQETADDIMARYAPVIKQKLHDALDPILGHVASEFRSQGEEARKELLRLIAIEKQKLARNLKALARLQRRRAGRVQRSRSRWTSSAFPRRRRHVEAGGGTRLRFPSPPHN